MGKHKARAFDKKNAQRFRLVPGGPDPFVQQDDAQEEYLDEDSRIQEQVKYGILYHDDYNYLQHLKSSGETPRLELVRYRIGAAPAEDDLLLNSKPAQIPTGDLIPEDGEVSDGDISEVDHQLDNDANVEIFKSDDEKMDGDDLEDDFIIQANCGALPSLDGHGLVTVKEYYKKTPGGRPHFADMDSGSELGSECEYESDGDAMDKYFNDKNVVVKGTVDSQQRSMLDERFAKILEGYDDDDIGALDEEEICGGSLQPNDDLFKQAEEDFEKRRKVNRKQPPKPPGQVHVMPPIKDAHESHSEDESDLGESDDHSDIEEFEKIKLQVKPKASKIYNCESILSITSSCIPAHLPKLIVEKSAKPRNDSVSSNVSKQPENKRSMHARTSASSESNSNADEESKPNNVPLVRKRDETTEERKQRKALVREQKKERRDQKKVLKTVFEKEKCVIERQLASTFSAVRLN